jgi:hypothetical protein
MIGKPHRRRRTKPRPRSAAYVLVVRGADGRLRAERFASAAAYRARLMTLAHGAGRGISFDELAGLFDA